MQTHHEVTPDGKTCVEFVDEHGGCFGFMSKGDGRIEYNATDPIDTSNLGPIVAVLNFARAFGRLPNQHELYLNQANQ